MDTWSPERRFGLDLQRRLDADAPTRAWFTSNGGANLTFLAEEVGFKNPVAQGAVPTAAGFYRFVRNLLRKAFGGRLNLQRVREHRIRKKDRTPAGWPASCVYNCVHVVNAAQRLALLKVYRTSRYWAHCGDWRDRADALLRDADRRVDTHQRKRKRGGC